MTELDLQGPGSDRIELLQTFIRIVEAGSLSAAAEQLGTTQPTVSRRLQALERALGLKLLQRSTHALTLTGDGERCFAHARELLEGWQAMEADLRGAKDEPRGTLRVLVPHAFGQDQLVAPVTEYLRRHPGVSVDWLLHDRPPDFIAEGIDCAIRVGSVEDPSVVAIRLAEVPRIVVAAPGLWDSGPPPGADALPALPWLALRTFYQREVVLTRLPGDPAGGDAGGDAGRFAFAIRPRLSTDSLYALRNAARAGLGAALVSAWVVDGDLRDGTLIHLAPAWEAAPLPVYLVYPQARFYPAKLRRFIELMRERMPMLIGMRPAGAAPAGSRPAPRPRPRARPR